MTAANLIRRSPLAALQLLAPIAALLALSAAATLGTPATYPLLGFACALLWLRASSQLALTNTMSARALALLHLAVGHLPLLLVLCTPLALAALVAIAGVTDADLTFTAAKPAAGLAVALAVPLSMALAAGDNAALEVRARIMRVRAIAWLDATAAPAVVEEARARVLGTAAKPTTEEGSATAPKKASAELV